MLGLKKALILILAVAAAYWLFIVLVKQLPHDNALRTGVFDTQDAIIRLLGGQPARYIETPEQGRARDVCFTLLRAGEQYDKLPPQCAAIRTCLLAAEDLLSRQSVAFAGKPSIYQVSKVSLGWEMLLLFLSPEDGAKTKTVRASLSCIASGENLVKLTAQ